MLSLIDPEYRPQATAIANIMYNAIGYFPAPFIYGIIQQNTGGKLSKWGMIFTLAMLVPGFILQALAMFYKPDLKDYWIEYKKRLLKKYM
jgi:predicted permease